MRGFELKDATTVQQAVDALKAAGTKNVKVLGGGSDLIGGVMKDWVSGKGMPIPDVLVDLTTIKDLVGVKASPSDVTLGAATTPPAVIDSKGGPQPIPVLPNPASSAPP